jgi:hypothetical protein
VAGRRVCSLVAPCHRPESTRNAACGSFLTG